MRTDGLMSVTGVAAVRGVDDVVARSQQGSARGETAAPARPPAGAEPDEAAAAAAAASATPERAEDERELREAVEQGNQALTRKASELTFEMDDRAGRVVVRLIDTSTREVLRQIPSREALAIARALAEGSGRGAFVKTDA